MDWGADIHRRGGQIIADMNAPTPTDDRNVGNKAMANAAKLWYYGLAKDDADNWGTLFNSDGSLKVGAGNTHGKWMLDQGATKVGCARSDELCFGDSVRVTCNFEAEGSWEPQAGAALGGPDVGTACRESHICG